LAAAAAAAVILVMEVPEVLAVVEQVDLHLAEDLQLQDKAMPVEGLLAVETHLLIEVVEAAVLVRQVLPEVLDLVTEEVERHQALQVHLLPMLAAAAAAVLTHLRVVLVVLVAVETAEQSHLEEVLQALQIVGVAVAGDLLTAGTETHQGELGVLEL